MNLTKFLKQVEELSAACTKEQLAEFIYDTGRGIPERNREEFLARLRSKGENAVTMGIRQAGETEALPGEALEKQCEQLLEELERIQEEDLLLEAELNEEYDDWYDEGEEFYYRDPHGITETIGKAFEFVHRCVDEGAYRQGQRVGQSLRNLQIFCDSEYDVEELSVMDVVYHELVDYDLKKLILDMLYCTYQTLPMQDRADAIYRIMEWAKDQTVTLEELIQYGEEELTEWPEFLGTWIDYLGKRYEAPADTLIVEAIGLLNDISLECGYADKYMDNHPGLYLHILKYAEGSNLAQLELIQLGKKAMETMRDDVVVRSAVALKTAGYIVGAHGDNPDQELLEQCYYAAFRSDTNAVNYLRALLHGFDTGEKRGKLHEVIAGYMPTRQKGPADYYHDYVQERSQRSANQVFRPMLFTLRLLDGQFENALSEGLSEKEALGWTGTFMKQGIALFLLGLCEGDRHEQGIRAMMQIAKFGMGFSAEDYRRGILDAGDQGEEELFQDVLFRWQELTPMDQEIGEQAVQKIEKLIENRTDAIMNANRRNYYGECAAFIAALGEVKESMGVDNAKQGLMTAYKMKYSRRISFRAELKRYGWKDR